VDHTDETGNFLKYFKEVTFFLPVFSSHKELQVCVFFKLYFLKSYQFQRMGGAFSDTGWFETRIETIHAEITFYGFAVIRILYWNIPGACCFAGHATYAFSLIDVDDSVFALNHCIRRTNRYTQRVVAVAASAEDDFGFWYASHHFQWGAANVAEERADRQVFVHLAVYLTTMAGYASFGVEVDHIFFHSSILLLVLRILFFTWTKTSQRLTPPPA
jgi:hypothetical protein